jgi:hypothetical protein
MCVQRYATCMQVLKKRSSEQRLLEDERAAIKRVSQCDTCVTISAAEWEACENGRARIARTTSWCLAFSAHPRQQLH